MKYKGFTFCIQNFFYAFSISQLHFDYAFTLCETYNIMILILFLIRLLNFKAQNGKPGIFWTNGMYMYMYISSLVTRHKEMNIYKCTCRSMNNSLLMEKLKIIEEKIRQHSYSVLLVSCMWYYMTLNTLSYLDIAQYI